MPTPKTMSISLEARLVHSCKAYEHHVGKALPTCSYTKNSLLTALVNCKARMVSCQYDSFLCCSWSVVMTTES